MPMLCALPHRPQSARQIRQVCLWLVALCLYGLVENARAETPVMPLSPAGEGLQPLDPELLAPGMVTPQGVVVLDAPPPMPPGARPLPTPPPPGPFDHPSFLAAADRLDAMLMAINDRAVGQGQALVVAGALYSHFNTGTRAQPPRRVMAEIEPSAGWLVLSGAQQCQAAMGLFQTWNQLNPAAETVQLAIKPVGSGTGFSIWRVGRTAPYFAIGQRSFQACPLR